MTCKGVMCTEKHLGIDTNQVKSLCKSIIKLCNSEPHAVDSLLEQAHIELSVVAMLMKQSADRARKERELYEKQQVNRGVQWKRIPDLATKYPTYPTSKSVEKMLASMDLEKLYAIAAKAKADR